MSKKPTFDKSINPAKADRPMAEGRDARPETGEVEFNFPHDGVTVVAHSQEEAEKKRDEILKARQIENKEEPRGEDK